MWNLIKENKIYVAIGAVLLIILVIIVVFILSGQRQGVTNSNNPGTRTDQTNALSKKLNYPNSPQKDITQEWIYYKTVNGSIKIRNVFPKDYSPSASTPLLLSQTDQYKIDYQPDGDQFELWITDQNDVDSAKKAAEQALVELFGAPKADLCQLPIYVYKSPPDDYRPNPYNVGLSFCPTE